MAVCSAGTSARDSGLYFHKTSNGHSRSFSLQPSSSSSRCSMRNSREANEHPVNIISNAAVLLPHNQRHSEVKFRHYALAVSENTRAGTQAPLPCFKRNTAPTIYLKQVLPKVIWEEPRRKFPLVTMGCPKFTPKTASSPI